ncbi:MAG: tetratricopeptide repeat protein [Myxococcota bacterium]
MVANTDLKVNMRQGGRAGVLHRAAAIAALAAFINAFTALPPARATLSGDLLTAGNRHYLRGETAEAREAYRKALAVQAGDPVAHYNLGVLLFEMGDLDGALTHFEQSTHTDPTRPEAWNNLAIVLCAKGYFDQAESMARRGITVDGQFAPAYNNLGLILDALARRDEARSAFERAVAIAYRFAEAQNNLGNSLARAGELEAARAAYDSGILANGKLAFLYFNRGLLSIRLGDYKEAVRDWERARRLDPEAAPDFMIASVALQGGDYQKALSHFEAIDRAGDTQRPPVSVDDTKPLFAPSGIEDPALREALAAVASPGKRAATADTRGEKAVNPARLSKDYADLGQVSRDRGLDARAEQLLSDAIRLDPGNHTARETLGEIYLKVGRSEEAVSVLAPLAASPDATSAQLSLLADAYRRANQLGTAAPLYQRAIDADPANADAYVGLGWIQVRSRRPEAGISAIRHGVSLKPKDSYARVTLADALQVADRPDRAEREYRRALRANRRDARAHAHYASFLASQARYADAEKHYAKALQYDPDAAGVADEIERLRTRKRAKVDSIWEGIVIMPLLPFIGLASLASRVAK